MPAKAKVRSRKGAKQLTVRGVTPEVGEALRREAERAGLNLNKTVLALLRRALGLEPKAGGKKVIGHSLDRFFGGWSEEEAADFDRRFQETHQIDPEMWK